MLFFGIPSIASERILMPEKPLFNNTFVYKQYVYSANVYATAQSVFVTIS